VKQALLIFLQISFIALTYFLITKKKKKMKQNDFFIGSQPKNNYSLLKKSIIGALLLCPFLHLNAQAVTTITSLQDFDGADKITLETEVGSTAAALSVVVNPGSNSVNASPNVAKYDRSTGAWNTLFYNINTQIPNATKFKSGTYKILIDVYSPAAEIPITLSLQDKSALAAWPVGINSEYTAKTTKQNEWETLTFTFQPNVDIQQRGGTTDSDVDLLGILFNGPSGAAGTYYFDNVRIEKTEIPVNLRNLALGQPAVASTTKDAAVANNVTDGIEVNPSRWESVHGGTDAQWIYVDLGANYAINKVVLKWEGAYATAYKLQISNDTDFSDAETVKDITGNSELLNELTGLSATGRYVRILGTTRFFEQYGYSLFEVEVYGDTPTTQLGINDITGKNTTSVALYPNPAHDFVKISSTEKLNNTVVTIYDLLGKQVLQSKLDDSKEESLININQLAKGNYILNINSDGKNFSKKLIKK
jgi:hypothetical protein